MKFRKKQVVIEAMQYYAGMPVIYFPAWLMVAKRNWKGFLRQSFTGSIKAENIRYTSYWRKKILKVSSSKGLLIFFYCRRRAY